MSEPSAASLDVVVLAHTHWDREWYHPAGRFRQRLVALIDERLASTAEGAPSFLLDGQGVVLDDYLEVRPEMRERLSAALSAGALEAGPWYVLADALLPSAEALVRNLLTGRRTLARLDAAPPAVLYCPDSFGHPAALPTLARGFGYAVAIVWRGFGGARWPAGDAARWRAPSGDEVLLYHLPPEGYEFGSALPTDDAGAAERWSRLRAVLAPRARLGVALVQNGADHHALQSGADLALRALARAARPEPVQAMSLRGFAQLLERRADGARLPTVSGELRDSYGYTWTLQGTFAARAAQKRRNAAVERALLRDCEPWAALAREDAPDGAAASGRRALLDAAWRTLLLCHPHDTLCGCSIDEVARAAEARLDDAAAQARGLREDALAAVIGHDAVAARVDRGAWVRSLVVRNRAARPRGGVAEVELLTFLQDVPVGAGSARVRPGSRRGRGAPITIVGNRGPVQILARSVRHDRVESPRHYPDDDLVEAASALVWVAPVAGYGTASYGLEERVPEAGDLPPDVRSVTSGDGTVDNGLLQLTVSAKGEVELMQRATGAVLPALIAFEDVGDAGDLYTHSPVGRPISATWFLGVRTVHRGPLRGTLEARWRMRLPARRHAGDDVQDPHARRGRGARHVEMTIVVRLTLDAGAPFLRVAVSSDNRARDHRLRVLFATGIREPAVCADAAFGPLTRLALDVPSQDRLAEIPPRTAPLHRYATLHGQGRGVTLFSDGLAEYEASDDGAIAVTLVRAVGELSRSDLPERPGHAGWPAAVPQAQSLGPFTARFAVLPHGALDDATADTIERIADDVLLSLVGVTLRSALAVPAPTRGVELSGAGLAFSAVKPSEDGEWLVLRCVNVTGATLQGSWRWHRAIREARLSRLDETPGAPLRARDDVVDFVSPPRAVVTVLVR